LDYELYGNGKYQKLFIQPMAALISKHSTDGLAFKMGFMPYEIKSLNPYYRNVPVELKHNYPSNFFEGWYYHKSYFENGIYASFFFGIYSFSSSTIPFPINNVNGGACFGIGLGFRGK
jgi:hypothetical protein